MTSQSITSTVEPEEDERGQRRSALGGLVLALAVVIGIGAWQVHRQQRVASRSEAVPAVSVPARPHSAVLAVHGTAVDVGRSDQEMPEQEQQGGALARPPMTYVLVGSEQEATALRQRWEDGLGAVLNPRMPVPAVAVVVTSAEDEAHLRQAIANETFLRLAARQEPPRVVDRRSP
jgi:hypothetical protein